MAAYGGALGEWLAPARRRHQPDADTLAELRAAWTAPGAPAGLWPSVEVRLDPERVARARAAVAERCAAALDPAQAQPSRPAHALLTPAGRADDCSLRWWSGDDPDLAEFRAAFRLSWAEITDWDWPARGCLQPFWAGQRFRLRPRVDFLSAVTAQSIGAALASILRPWSGREAMRRQVRVQRLIELNAPQVILDNERLLLAAEPDPLGLAAVPDDRLSRGRALHLVGTEDEQAPSGYGYGRMAQQMAALAAEVAVSRSARSSRVGRSRWSSWSRWWTACSCRRWRGSERPLPTRSPGAGSAGPWRGLGVADGPYPFRRRSGTSAGEGRWCWW